INSPMAARVYASRDAPDARHLQEQLTTVRSVIEKRTMIPGLKHLMAAATGRRDWLNMRPPNVPLDAAEATNLENELNALGFDLVHCRTFFQ
ncbi:MAG: hypothetical protein JW884_12215, partial [Deltaproteobacteria bacterium]|nr:hypothetical protein [Deltaproteobacteria bacterium]